VINLANLNTRQLATTYLVANTPAFLYNAFRTDASVQRLATENTSDDLAQHVEQIAGQETRSVKETVSAYAALVALTLQPYPAARLLVGRQIAALEWAHDLLRLYDDTRVGNEVITVQASPRVSEATPTPAATTNSSIILSGH